MVPLPFVHRARWRGREIGFPSPPPHTQVPRDSAVGEVEVSGTRLSRLQTRGGRFESQGARRPGAPCGESESLGTAQLPPPTLIPSLVEYSTTPRPWPEKEFGGSFGGSHGAGAPGHTALRPLLQLVREPVLDARGPGLAEAGGA